MELCFLDPKPPPQEGGKELGRADDDNFHGNQQGPFLSYPYRTRSRPAPTRTTATSRAIHALDRRKLSTTPAPKHTVQRPMRRRHSCCFIRYRLPPLAISSSVGYAQPSKGVPLGEILQVAGIGQAPGGHLSLDSITYMRPFLTEMRAATPVISLLMAYWLVRTSRALARGYLTPSAVTPRHTSSTAMSER